MPRRSRRGIGTYLEPSSRVSGGREGRLILLLAHRLALALLPSKRACPATARLVLKSLLKNFLALIGKLPLQVAGLLKEAPKLLVLGIADVRLAILGPLKGMIENGDHVISLVARAGLLSLLFGHPLSPFAMRVAGAQLTTTINV